MSKEEKEWDGDFSVVRGSLMVELEHIGEGYNGDYDPDDPGDRGLVRFTVYEKVDGIPGVEWEPYPDGSYCTMLTTSTPREELKEFGEDIISAILAAQRAQKSVKRTLERLSWTSELPVSVEGA